MRFYGRVVRSSASCLTLRLSDGKTVSFSSKQVFTIRKRVNAQWHKRRALTSTTLHVHAGLNVNALAPAEDV